MFSDSSFSPSSETYGDVPTFTLLRLPKNALLNTIRLMDLDEILSFSLFSKRCKQHVTSVKIKAISLELMIGNCVTLVIQTATSEMILEFTQEENGDDSHTLRKYLDAPRKVEAWLTETVWEGSSFEYQDWLHHLLTVFHHQGIDSFEFGRFSFQYDIDEVINVFGKTNNLIATHTGHYEYNKNILEKFLPVEKLSIQTDMFENSEIPLQILIQHHERLTISIIFGNKMMNLDNLLLINSKSIVIRHVNVPDRALNKFLKLWIKGANPQLESLSILYLLDAHPNPDELMKGIKCQGEYNDLIFYRADGTRATLCIGLDDEGCELEMNVERDSRILHISNR